MSALMRALQTVAGAGARRAGGVPLREALASRAGMLGLGALGVSGAMMASDAAGGTANENDAGSLGDASLQAAQERLAELEALEQLRPRSTTDAEGVRAYQDALKLAGYYGAGYTPDGRWGPGTEGAVGRLTGDMTAARTDLERLSRDARFRAREPDSDTERFREIGPNAGVIGGIAAALLLRGGLVGGGALLRAARNRNVMRLLSRAGSELPSGASVAAREARLDRVSALNEFWRQGGSGGSRVPFVEAKTNAGFAAAPTRNVVRAGDLYPPGSKHFRLGDGLTMAGSGIDVTVTSGMLAEVERELRVAEEELSKDSSDANIARVESLRNQVAMLKTARGVGIGVGVGSLAGLKIPYSQSRPDFMLADRERMALSRFLRSRRKR